MWVAPNLHLTLPRTTPSGVSVQGMRDVDVHPQARLRADDDRDLTTNLLRPGRRRARGARTPGRRGLLPLQRVSRAMA